MICNYFRVIHIIVEKIIIGSTQPCLEDDASETSPEGPLKVLTFEIFRGPSEDSQGVTTKTDDFIKKLFFRSNSPCIIYLLLFFTGKANIQKF